MLVDKETYRVGIYTRLSIDDGNNEENVKMKCLLIEVEGTLNKENMGGTYNE